MSFALDCQAGNTVANAELVLHAGKSAREQRGYFTNSEYIGDYPCRLMQPMYHVHGIYGLALLACKLSHAEAGPNHLYMAVPASKTYRY